MSNKIILGTRGSKLSTAYANRVINLLLAGLVTVKVSPLYALIHFPLTKALVMSRVGSFKISFLFIYNLFRYIEFLLSKTRISLI